MSASELVAYTAIFGNRDVLRDPSVLTDGCRYVCFTDQGFKSNVWEVVKVEAPPDDPRRASRRFKMLPHRVLDAQLSAWVDGSFRINVDLRAAFGSYLRQADVAAFAHPARDCVYDEAAFCVRLGLDDPDGIARQVARYRRAGYPEHHGLISAGVLLRRHTDAVATFDEAWWAEYQAGSDRDQLSFGYCAWQLGLRVATIPGNIRAHPEFQLIGHAA